jgi:AcrR family transcriptional regulator
MSSGRSAGGRPRDPELEARILAATRQLLAERGYRRLSIGAVARLAGTTRPTIYLRFAGKEELATSAIAAMPVADPLPVTADIRADLVAELRHFRTAITRPNGFSLVGTVLAEEQLTPRLAARFRERLVLPRRRRLAATLHRGAGIGALRPGLDVEAVTGMLTGSLYAHHLAHGAIPEDWPERVVDALWPALRSGGSAQPVEAEEVVGDR